MVFTYFKLSPGLHFLVQFSLYMLDKGQVGKFLNQIALQVLCYINCNYPKIPPKLDFFYTMWTPSELCLLHTPKKLQNPRPFTEIQSLTPKWPRENHLEVGTLKRNRFMWPFIYGLLLLCKWRREGDISEVRRARREEQKRHILHIIQANNYSYTDAHLKLRRSVDNCG